MEVITKELTIDLYGPTLRYAVEAHQGDRATRVLLITVTEDGRPFTLPTGADYIAQIRKPNRVTVYKKCTMSNNTITLTLPGNALDKRGRATCEIVINESGNDQTLTTQAFEIEIHPKQGAGNSIESSDNIPSMEDQIAKNKTDIAALFQTTQNHQQTLGLHDERITILEETSVEHTQQIQEAQANILNKIDGAYVENGYLYLTANEEVVAGPLGPFSGSGGGGGTGSNNATLTMNNTTGWLAKTVAQGGDCIVTFDWSSLEDEIPTGSGSMTIRVNNAVKTTRNVNQGSVPVNLAPYLGVGSNAVKVSIADVYGNARTINFSITVVAVSISSTFDATVPYTGNITFTYTPVGSVNKTVHFILDGVEVNSTTTAASGRQQSVLIPAQRHGAHSFEVYFTAEIDGETVQSNTLYYELICVEEGEEAPIIVTSFNAEEVDQYASVAIPYIVYNPLSMLAAVTLAVNGETVTELPEVDRTEQTWTYRADVAGPMTLTITSGETVKTIELNVAESDIDVEAETEDLTLFLSSYGRSNGEENPAVWKYGNVAATFTGFNWVSDGWQMDEDKISVLRVAGDARVEIPLNIFGTDFRGTGKTIEIEFATRDVMDYDAVILSCLSGGRGIVLTSQLATMTSEQSTIFTQYKENEHVRLSFVVEKRVENRLIYCYINGVMCGVVQYPTDDDFAQAVPVGISIGSNDSTIDLYCIRVYDNNLTRFQVLNNWIADTQNGGDMLERYLRNNVFDAYGQIVIENLPKDLPYLVLEAAELPQSKGDKKTVSGSFTHPIDATRCFTFEEAQADVQGTSSATYARKNYKIKFKGGFKNSSGGTLETFTLRAGTIPTDTFTFKADVASSEGANNVELARLYNDACPYKTPPQLEDERVRQGIDGFPIVIFWSDGNTTTFMGKYNFNHDKGTPEVFGFDEDDESWEIKNNTSDRVLWKSADYTGTDWQNDFEARHPEDNTDTTRLQTLAAWLVSTDQTQATGGELPASVSYGEETFTHDTAAYRLAKFKAELADYAEVDALIFNYVFTELFLMVDNRAKNAFPTFYNGGKWTILPYDFDTAIGINNEGALTFGYSLEDIDTTESGANVYNGQESVLYVNLRAGFYDRITEMYQTLRSTKALSYEGTEQRFEEHQAVWPEAIFNEDAWFKYLQPLVEQNTAAYLSMLQGSKAEQRKWWLYNRFRYLDSKYNAGDALTDLITLRGYAKADITVTPYADIYASIKYGSYLQRTRAFRNNAYTLPCPLDEVNDTEIYIYSCSQLKDVGDLSGLKVGYAEFSMATKLQRLKIGDASADYQNLNLTELYLGNNRLLRHLDVRNCPNLGTGEAQQAVDLSGCVNIEEAYFDGTSITGLTLPNGGILKVLHLPSTIANLTIRNQGMITEFSMPSYENIATLRLENVSAAVPSQAILKALPANSRVRLIGFSWEVESGDALVELANFFDTMRGLDEAGNNVDMAQLIGTIHVPSLTGAQLAEVQAKYPDVKVTYDHITSYVYYYTYDGLTLLHTEAITDGADATYTGQPSRASTAQYSYTFTGWSRKANGSADSTAQKAVEADRNLYAAYSATVRKYTVYFYNGSTLLQTVTDVPYGSSATYTGDTPVSSEGSAEDYPFQGWSPSPTNIKGNTSCYAQFGSPLEIAEITDDWAAIFAAIEDGTYRQKYSVGNYKALDMGTEGVVNMQIAAFDKDTLADGSGTAAITWISKELLATSRRMNPDRVDNYTYPEAASWKESSTANVWNTTTSYCKDSVAEATWTITATEEGTLTISYKTSNSNASRNKITVTVNGEAIATDYTGTTYVAYEVAVAAGDVVEVTAAYTLSYNGSYTGSVKIEGTGAFTVEADVKDAPNRVFSHYSEGTGTIGGWEKTEMRTKVKEVVLPLIPAEVSSRIKAVVKTHTAYDTAGKSFSQTTNDDVWLPDYYEVYGSTCAYKTLFPDNASRVKYKVGATSASWWWLRGAYGNGNFYGIVTSGDWYYNLAYGSGAVALGFCT